MDKNAIFNLRTIADFRALVQQLGCDIDTSPDISALVRPVEIAGTVVPNALAVQPMEGCDGDHQGRPGPLTHRRYRRFAAGGAGLIWFEAIAVNAQGRANPRQLWINDKSADSFAQTLVEMQKAAQAEHGNSHKPIIIAQLTHSGRYSKPTPMIAQRDPHRDPMTAQPMPDTNRPSAVTNDMIISDAYLDKLQDDFIRAAELACRVGFDGVDIKACHGYLISELLAARNRPGKYGSSFENRTRFMLEVIDKIRRRLDSDFIITSRLGFYDAVPYPYGWGVDKNDYRKPDLAEAFRLVELLRQRDIRLINFTAANPYYNPHIGRPFAKPPKGAYDTPEHPLVGVGRLVDLAGQVQRKFADITIVGTGYSWLGQFMPNVAAAAVQTAKAGIIGAGRLAFAYPDFAADILRKGRLDKQKICLACSGCTQLMRQSQPTGCVIRDKQTYAPLLKSGL